MKGANNMGEGPAKKNLNFWGRVTDSRGNNLAGALVILTAPSSGGEEKCLGHTYSNRQGLYMIGISPESLKNMEGSLRIMASSGHASVEEEGADRQHLFFAAAGQGRPALECQVINYQRLKLVICRHGRQLTVEAVPETVRVSFLGDKSTGARVFGLRGRGYISCGDDHGDGFFSLAVCVLGEGLQEQEIIRIKTVPDDSGRRNLLFDSGSTLTDMFN